SRPPSPARAAPAARAAMARAFLAGPIHRALALRLAFRIRFRIGERPKQELNHSGPFPVSGPFGETDPPPPLSLVGERTLTDANLSCRFGKTWPARKARIRRSLACGWIAIVA